MMAIYMLGLSLLCQDILSHRRHHRNLIRKGTRHALVIVCQYKDPLLAECMLYKYEEDDLKEDVFEHIFLHFLWDQ